MIKVECGKCAGKGTINGFSHVKGGVCFTCGGKGYKMQKSKPRPSATYSFSFLWKNPSDANYNAGEFLKCFNKKARSDRHAEKIAEEAMAKNGSQGYSFMRLEDA
jgi:hypothetical protein